MFPFPELLPDIDNFLRHVLKKETLSSLAEKKRKYYVDRLDVFILPPNLPPRPEGRSILGMRCFTHSLICMLNYIFELLCIQLLCTSVNPLHFLPFLQAALNLCLISVSCLLAQQCDVKKTALAMSSRTCQTGSKVFAYLQNRSDNCMSLTQVGENKVCRITDLGRWSKYQQC